MTTLREGQDQSVDRSDGQAGRRAVLRAGLTGGIGAAAFGRLFHADAARAATGDPVILGVTNEAYATTTLTNPDTTTLHVTGRASSVPAMKVTSTEDPP